jgi:hypothetical protein
MKHAQFVPLFILMLGMVTTVGANSSRLTVFNEVLSTTPDVPSTFPVYLSRLGTYYAELYIEPGDAAAERLQTLVDLDVTVSFQRREKILFARDVTVQFSPEKNAAILFSISRSVKVSTWSSHSIIRRQ